MAHGAAYRRLLCCMRAGRTLFNQKYSVPCVLCQGSRDLTINMPSNPVLKVWLGKTLKHAHYSKQVSPPREAGRIIQAL